MTTNARMGLAMVGFLVIAGIATFACAERGTGESDAGMDPKDKGKSEKRGRRGRRRQQEKSADPPMEAREEAGDEMTADKGRAIEPS